MKFMIKHDLMTESFEEVKKSIKNAYEKIDQTTDTTNVRTR